MNDVEKARTVPCPDCKRPAGSKCVHIETNVETTGVHSSRIYRAYLVGEAIAENRAIDLEAALDEVLNAFRRSLARGMSWNRGEVARALHRLNKSFPEEKP